MNVEIGTGECYYVSSNKFLKLKLSVLPLLLLFPLAVANSDFRAFYHYGTRSFTLTSDCVIIPRFQNCLFQWNMLPLKKRLAWENAARELLMKAAKASAQVASVDSTTGGNAPEDSTTGISAPADSATGGSAVEDGATTDVAADSTSVDSASAENGSAEIDKENKEDKGKEIGIPKLVVRLCKITASLQERRRL